MYISQLKKNLIIIIIIIYLHSICLLKAAKLCILLSIFFFTQVLFSYNQMAMLKVEMLNWKRCPTTSFNMNCLIKCELKQIFFFVEKQGLKQKWCHALNNLPFQPTKKRNQSTNYSVSIYVSQANTISNIL